MDLLPYEIALKIASHIDDLPSLFAFVDALPRDFREKITNERVLWESRILGGGRVPASCTMSAYRCCRLTNRRFDPGTMTPNSVAMIVGHRGAGKSVLVRDLLWWHRTVPYGCVMVNRRHADAYRSCVPSNLVLHRYDPHALEGFLKRQRKRQVAEPSGSFLVLDDVLSSRELREDPGVRELFLNGRCMRTTMLVAMQHGTSVPPELRGNTDYAFLFDERLPANRKRLFDNFASAVVPSMEVFDHLMDNIPGTHACLVIDNRVGRGRRPEDGVSYYIAKQDHAPFRTCSEAMWTWCETNPVPVPSSSEDDDDHHFASEMPRHSNDVSEDRGKSDRRP